MESRAGLPSMATLFSAYATITTFITLLQQAFNQFIPQRVQDYLYEKLEQWFNKPKSSASLFTLVIEQSDELEGYRNHNQVFEACEKYLCSKLSNFANRLKVTRPRAEDMLAFSLAEGQEFREVYEGVEFTWNYVISANENSEHQSQERRHFELTCEKKHKDKALNSYLPFVLNFYNELQEKQKELKLHTLDKYGGWHAIEFKHPFTFDSLAMDPDMKKAITDDLDRFIKRKEFYKRVGKAWKRGYLLYGPPGTGKSSLVAAMANHLKFDIYDLQLSQVDDDATLRNLMVWTTNKSILVIEDIDCCSGLPNRRENIEVCSDDDQGSNGGDENWSASKISLSGLLNFLDGLWSSCGDERIIIFTTNQKDKLDPALLRPGRMDMHIHMSYLTMPGFRVLASNYLDVSDDDDHPLLFKEIESLIGNVNITAAQVGEEILRSEDAEIALRGVIELLKKKKSERTKMK